MDINISDIRQQVQRAWSHLQDVNKLKTGHLDLKKKTKQNKNKNKNKKVVVCSTYLP